MTQPVKRLPLNFSSGLDQNYEFGPQDGTPHWAWNLLKKKKKSLRDTLQGPLTQGERGRTPQGT